MNNVKRQATQEKTNITTERLYSLLKETRTSQTELARAISTSNATVSRYLSGERSPNSMLLALIAQHFNVNSDYLLGKTDIKNRAEERFADIPEAFKAIAVKMTGFTELERKALLDKFNESVEEYLETKR